MKFNEKKYYCYHYKYSKATPLAGVVFYVGKGTGRRILDHEKEARTDCACSKCKAIRYNWSYGENPDKGMFFWTNDEFEAFETEYIAITETHAGTYLTNVRPGCRPVRQVAHCKEDVEKEQRMNAGVQRLHQWYEEGFSKYIDSHQVNLKELDHQGLYMWVDKYGFQLGKGTNDTPWWFSWRMKKLRSLGVMCSYL